MKWDPGFIVALAFPDFAALHTGALQSAEALHAWRRNALPHTLPCYDTVRPKPASGNGIVAWSLIGPRGHSIAAAHELPNRRRGPSELARIDREVETKDDGKGQDRTGW